MNTWKCEICDEPAQEIMLAGVYVAQLCLPCRREWDRHCWNLPAFQHKVGGGLLLDLETKKK